MNLFKLSAADFVEEAWKVYYSNDQIIEDWRKESRQMRKIDVGDHWSEEDISLMEEEERPHVTFNRTAKVIDGVSGTEIVNRQESVYLPRGMEEQDRVQAEIWNGATKWVRDLTDAEDEESDAFRDTLVMGMAWTETLVDYTENPDGDIVIERADPEEMRWDTTASKRNITDRQWNIREKWIKEDEVNARWPGKNLQAEQRDMDLAEAHDADNTDYENNQFRSYNPHTKEYKVLQFQWVELEAFQRGVGQDGQLVEVTEGGVRQYRKKYYQAYVAAKTLLEKKSSPVDSFTFECITGKREKRDGHIVWYGMMRAMKDPQLWANKFFSQIMHIYNSNPKGVTFFETGTFKDPEDARQDVNRPAGMVEINPGFLNRMKHENAMNIPANLDRMLQYAIAAIPDVSGVNDELLGLTDRDQPGIVETQRMRQAIAVLSPMFDSLRRYRKRHGRLLIKFIKKFISDGRVVRVVGDELGQGIQLTTVSNAEVDIIVQDAPTAPNAKTEAWAALTQLIPILQNSGFPVIPEVIDYVPLPLTLTSKWKQAHQMTTQQLQELQQELQKVKEENLILTAKREERVDANQTKQVKEVLTDQREKAALAIKGFEAETNRMKVQSNGSD